MSAAANTLARVATRLQIAESMANLAAAGGDVAAAHRAEVLRDAVLMLVDEAPDAERHVRDALRAHDPVHQTAPRAEYAQQLRRTAFRAAQLRPRA